MKGPNFVVGHLRSGTAFMASMLNACPEANAEWEGLFRLTCYEIDPASTAYYEGRCSSQEVRDLIQFYRLSKRPIGVDSFFRLPWILPPLLEEYPEAKFVHIVRNPKDCVKAAYNDTDCYGDALLAPQGKRAFLRWCVENDPTGLPGQSGSALRGGPATFHAITQRRLCHPRVKRPDWESLSRFEKTCAYWTEAQRLCIASLATRKGQYLRVRLEDLATVEHARTVFEFLDLEVPPTDKLAARLAQKVNTAAVSDPYWIAVRGIKEESGAELIPAYAEWSDAYKEGFERICGATARECGYS